MVLPAHRSIRNTLKKQKNLAKKGHSLVYGGFHEKSGQIIGIAPTSFMNVDGVLYDQCSQFIYTETMRERKQLMEEKSDAFIVTPGGIGTFEEFFEVLTLEQYAAPKAESKYYKNMEKYVQPCERMLAGDKKALAGIEHGNISKDNMEEFLTAIGRYKLEMLNDYKSVYDEDLSFSIRL